MHFDPVYPLVEGIGNGDPKQIGIGVAMLAAAFVAPEADVALVAGEEAGAAAAAESAADAVDVAANRVTLRVGTKAEIRANAPKTADGDFIDPNTGQVIPKDGPFDYGHQPGYEWWRTQQIARDQGWTRQQLIEYENDASHFQIEDPASNRIHAFEMPR